MSKILVIGASGTVGTELVKLLKERGHDVRSATSKNELDQDQVHLNLATKEGLDEALKDMEKVFLLCPPGYANQHELLIPVIEKAKSTNLKKLVLMTAMGANAVEAAPLRQAEVALEKSALTYNIIRPNWFMQNFNTFWIQGILSAGKIFLPVGTAKGSFIDARDIAAVAAELLSSDQFNNQAFDLTGPEALNHDQVAEILSQTTGKKIVFEDVTPDFLLTNLLNAGVPQPYANFLLMILDFFKQGYSERKTDNVEKIIGHKPISFSTYAKDYRNFWTK